MSLQPHTTTNNRIPDGYATIRRSGPLRHPSIKRSKFVPKTRSTSDLSVLAPPSPSDTTTTNNNAILTQLDSINNENNNFTFPSSSSTAAMKDENNDDYANFNETSCYNYSLPPLKSPQYINRLNTFRTKAKQDINLYQRPRSPTEFQSLPIIEPLYQNVPQSPIYANFNGFRIPPPPPPPRDYQSLAKLKTFHSLYDESVTKRKPPIKSSTLQRTYNGNNNGSELNIYAEPVLVPLANSTNIGSSEFSDISSDGYSSRFGRRSASDIVSLDFGPSTSYKQRYATFGYQKKGEGEKLAAGKSTGSLNEAQLDYFDIINSKVGCQNSVRTKPKVPWYELAIKKDNRQSCPPLYEGEVWCERLK